MTNMGLRVAAGIGLSPVPDAAIPAVPVTDLDPSPATRIIDRMKPMLKGRCIAILVDEGSNAESVAALRKAIEAQKATVKIIAPRIEGIKLSNGKAIHVDGQLAGSPSAQLDAIVSIIALESGKKLSKDAAAQNWFRDAFGHLKAIAACKGTQAILAAGGVNPDAGVIDPSAVEVCIKAAQTRFWNREPKIRTFA